MKPTDDRATGEVPFLQILRNAAEIMWDIAILGAGPAGSVAASLLAARGKRVLLVEKSAWPREKVCGGCLNAAAVQALTSAGLASSFRAGQPITRAVWHVGQKSLEMSAAGGVAMLRSDLDAALVNSAIERGCAFLPNTATRLLPDKTREDHRVIQLKTAGLTKNIRAKAVLACDGIAGTSVDDEPWANWRIEHNAWMGVSMTCADFGFNRHADAIHMHIARGGYVGAVRIPGGQVHLAAALDPVKCRKAGGPAPLIEKILRACGQPDIPNLQNLRLRGTGAMTRRREHPGGHRVLAVGDSCGYVEPFTGEGMAWAIRGAIEAVALLPIDDRWPEDLPAQWAIFHGVVVRQKQRWCRALRPLVHHPSMAALGITAARVIPAIGTFLSNRIHESNFPIAAQPQGDFG